MTLEDEVKLLRTRVAKLHLALLDVIDDEGAETALVDFARRVLDADSQTEAAHGTH